MERLTERGKDGKYFVRISRDSDLILGAEERLSPGLEKWTGWWEHTVWGNIVDRLAAYEDTGFTPEEVQQMRWIPVEERFPEDRLPAGRKQITVMVATKAGKVTIASRVFEPEREYYGKKYPARWVWSRWLNHYVTHWAPLPSAPKEEKK